MTYAELIKYLWTRQELGVKDYAEAVNYSTTQISNILNEKQPGSLKALLACLKHAGIDIQECLRVPRSEAPGADQYSLSTKRLHELLDIGEPIKTVIATSLKVWHEHYVAADRKRPKTSGRSGKRS